jgi:hypothetical protein
VVGVFGVADLACDLGMPVTMRWPWVAMASFVVVLLVLALGHRWSMINRVVRPPIRAFHTFLRGLDSLLTLLLVRTDYFIR